MRSVPLRIVKESEEVHHLGLHHLHHSQSMFHELGGEQMLDAFLLVRAWQIVQILMLWVLLVIEFRLVCLFV